jgi:hypothetical protein
MAAFAFFAVLRVFSQTSSENDVMGSQIRQGLLNGRDRALLTQRNEHANEIRNGSVSYSGILVELYKADTPLQLINPAAPLQYGASWDNVVVDPSAAPTDSSRQGLKIFSIGFK